MYPVKIQDLNPLVPPSSLTIEPTISQSYIKSPQGYPERPACIPDRLKPVIYMYELPHSVSSPIELDDNLEVGRALIH